MSDTALINRAAVIRLYPNREQAAALRRWQGGLRFVWNATWAWCKTQRETAGKWPSKAAIQARMVAMKKEAGTEWIADLPAHAILALADDMARAMRNWFEKRAKMPKFRGKHQRAFSVYMVNQATKFGEQHVKLPKLGDVRFRGGELPEGRLLSSRVYREADKWFMSAVFECPAPAYVASRVECIGIDMGLKTLATGFDGERFHEVPKLAALRKHEQRLKRYQRRVSRRVKGSKRRERAKQAVARLHQRIANIRKDYAHNETSKIVAMADTIKVESLNVRGMLKNRHISKSVADASMGMFLGMLRYKAAWQRRTVVELGRWEATTKTCSACGEKNPRVVLGVSDWVCPACGVAHDRDRNAAMNIFAYGEERRNVAGNTAESAWSGGDQVAGTTRHPVPHVEARMLKQATQVHRVAQSK